MDRDKTIDCLKGYACFLVVFGHVILGIRNMGGVRLPTLAYPIEQFIWSFHVPIFFFCSGYVFQINGGWKRSRNRTEFLKHKLLNLGVPYFAFSMLYILINSLVPGTNSRFSVADLVSLWRKPIAQYWYLYALFMLFFLYVALSRRLTDPQITVLLLIVRYICALFSVLIPLVGYAVSNCVAFGLGVSFRDLKIIERRKVFACGMGIVQVGFFVGAYGFGLLSCPVVEDLLRALGAVTSVMVISCVCEKKMIQKALCSLTNILSQSSCCIPYLRQVCGSS